MHFKIAHEIVLNFSGLFFSSKRYNSLFNISYAGNLAQRKLILFI